MAIFKTRFSPINYFTTIVTTFIVIQVVIFLLSQYTDIEFIKMGWVLLLFAAIAGITSIFTMSLKIGELKLKEDGVFIFLIFLSVVAAFIFLPKYIPQIFSTYSIEISEVIRESTNSIVSSIGEGIGVTTDGGLI